MAFLWFLACFVLLGVSSGHGEPAILPELSIKPRIINGKDAQPGVWPWHVVLLNGTGYFSCGGSLINSSWVITAAHCNITRSSWAVVGLYNLRSPGDIQRLRIAQIFRHPMFNDSTPYNNIALLKLSTMAHLNRKLSPLLLPRMDEQFRRRSWPLCKIMGFGSIDSNGIINPNKLQEATVTIMHNSRCKNFWDDISLDDMLCAGARGVSPTPGDSGGSVVCWKNKVWTLAGIISFSPVGFPTNRPFLATRISAFIPWIEEILAHN